MPGGHYPRGPVENRAEVVPVPQLGLTGRHAHPHRQLQRNLGSDSGINRALRRGECRAHPVTGVFEQPAPVRLDCPAQHMVMRGQRRPHAIGVGLPPTGRTLDVGEQKRHHPRRGSRRRSGHPRRISQWTRCHLAHRWNPAPDIRAPRRGVAATRWPDRSGDKAHAGWLMVRCSGVHLYAHTASRIQASGPNTMMPTVTSPVLSSWCRRSRAQVPLDDRQGHSCPVQVGEHAG